MKKKFKLSEKEYEIIVRVIRKEKLDVQEKHVLKNFSKRVGNIIFGETIQLN